MTDPEYDTLSPELQDHITKIATERNVTPQEALQWLKEGRIDGFTFPEGTISL